MYVEVSAACGDRGLGQPAKCFPLYQPPEVVCEQSWATSRLPLSAAVAINRETPQCFMSFGENSPTHLDGNRLYCAAVSAMFLCVGMLGSSPSPQRRASVM